MTLLDALKLGRVSNLPTVWTNTLAGMVLAGGILEGGPLAALMAAMTLFYVGGMYLNDAFDAGIDAVERPERPIPSGRVSRGTIFAAGFTMLGIGVVLVATVVADWRADPAAAISALALGGAIVLYDAWHKSNPLSPVVMGACRALVYTTAALCVASPLGGTVLLGAAMLLCYLIGLTYVAKQENIGEVRNMWPLAFLAAPVVYGAVLASETGLLVLGPLAAFVIWMLYALRLVRRRGPGDIPRAVVSLIAGMCLFDAMVVTAMGEPTLALVAAGGFLLTLAFQRWVPGT